MTNIVEYSEDKTSNMKIMIIEDEEDKYNKLIEVLNKLLDNPIIIIRAKLRNSGLRIIKEYYQNNNYFNLIICDNYMPLFDDDSIILPCASNIINYIKRFISKDVPICIYSSDEIDSCSCDYFIKYDRSISKNIFEEELKQILIIIKCYLENNIIKSSLSATILLYMEQLCILFEKKFNIM